MSAPSRPSARARIAEPLSIGGVQFADVTEFHRWFAGVADRTHMTVERLGLAELTGWAQDEATGIIRHHSGKFFSVESLDVRVTSGPVPQWSQPIINQPEVGILGILIKDFDGVPHCLMQAKHEPGNHNGLQLSPTVQATKSNYTRVHGGRSVPYLDYFRNPAAADVIADTRQSEQGSWFYRKRNRNMIVQVPENGAAADDLTLEDGFCWLTLGQVYELLRVPDLVNMDARTVLACLPFAGVDVVVSDNAPAEQTACLTSAVGASTDFESALARSRVAERGLHTTGDVLSWITDTRIRTDLHAERGPLAELRGWQHDGARIFHETGRFFDVIGVGVDAGGREIASWTQPMIEQIGTGVVAFLVKPIDGVLHVLMHARTEPGYTDVTELAPTVQCVPQNYDVLPAAARPPFLDEVLDAAPERIRFDTILSEEGGRFFGARNRYLVVETDLEALPAQGDYRWLTLHQLAELMRHSFYLNVQARSLVVCLRSLATASPGPRGAY
ncbi:MULTISPECIES: NDP-hexose 2,3-dehydratase family protein [Actinoalloteichus]|uniref:NDP-hexose 2,3-dehydratase n=1 Tax=Actinoalloteichus fjordicus TaxID=1612552 RepID=A0AAC9LB65_9PSEU|nr:MULTISPECIES: NDP-hexose 2,3-dehydratase family protein [Actinoalloteichus]APU13210.1 NDP-hexose 2,3-dehydratase [Actinoalloteichus fjordicus]APU19161.1 NDP-hexose 2,3-dehydratase [Actinoalloteichus sp. GBA129-24]